MVQFIYGRKEFGMDSLRHLYDWVRDESRLRNDPGRAFVLQQLSKIFQLPELFAMATVGTLEQKAVELTKCLHKCRTSQCRDPRDHVYGLLGIMTAMFGADFLKVNYTLSIADVYTDFTRKLITTTRSLAILNLCDQSCNSLPGLPSWVPDLSSVFSQPDAHNRLSYYTKFEPNTGPYNGTQSSRQGSQSGQRNRNSPQLSPGPQRPSLLLKCSGHVFATVVQTGECVRSMATYLAKQEAAAIIEGWQKASPDSTDAIVRMITVNEWGHHALRLEECCETMRSASDGAETTPKLRETIQSMIGGRRLILTDFGQVGLGPRQSRKGDVLAILDGGRVPYVLRSSAKVAKRSSTPTSPTGGLLGWGNTRRPDRAASDVKENNRYALIGEAYVDGIMHGELMRGGNKIAMKDLWLE
jgi:hypothetical protein